MTHKEKALDLFGQKYLCSQAVLAAFAKECGLTEKQALMLAWARLQGNKQSTTLPTRAGYRSGKGRI